MAAKLKTKVALGGVFLFALLILVGGVSTYYLNQITAESGKIIKNNYETLNYSREMLAETDHLSGPDSSKALQNFEKNLRLQETNITENGEKELTESLRNNFNALKQNPVSDSLPVMIRANISSIMHLNLAAIDKKNQSAKASSDDAKTIITIILTLCVLTGMTFIYNFPSLVAGPVTKLTRGIRAIASKDYSERIHLERKDEFGELANAFNSMAEKLDEYEHSNLSKILFEKKRAETVINSLKDASIGMDDKGVVLFANQQVLQLLNLSEPEVIGQLQKDVEKRNDLFRFLINEQNVVPFKIILDGKENYFIKEIIDIRHEEKKVGSVIILKNITSFKELDVAKTNFIATVSHELKTPLASSDFSLKLLEDERIGTLTAEQKDLVQHLRDDNQRMLRILSELLNMSQVEAGKIQLDIRPVDPLQPVYGSVNAVNTPAKEKGISIDRLLDGKLPTINADADKIGWVLNNFLSNAIRHSPAGSHILIEVKKNDGFVSYAVSDQGPGIDEAYQKRIFERYFQVPGRLDKKGSGIGLAICKEFIEAMGGVIWVKSQVGKGSTFGFDLPV